MNIWNKSSLAFVVAISFALAWPAAAVAAASTEPTQDSAAATAAGQDPALKNATQKGLPLPVISNVSDAATIQAILIPASVAQRIFGREVSKNYAVIEVVISNRDPKAALVVHSLFMDDSNWLLRGNGAECKSTAAPAGPASNQSATKPCQVASIESRLVRGEALDAQQWTYRNWTIRGLTALGTIGAGFEFPFSPDVIKGISTFNGVLVPAATALWPDGTINQINRISDVGFQTNKIIGKQSADIIVAFFPIERFLTYSFRNLFLKDPSALFVPGEMMADPKRSKDLLKILKPLTDVILKEIKPEDVAGNMLRSTIVGCGTGDEKAYRKAHDAHEVADEKDFANMCGAQKLLSGLSLNNIRVVVEGVMTVDVATVPATVYSVDFDKNPTAIWTTLGTDQTGTITGVYLTGGIPSVVDENGKAIDDVTIKVVADGSSDTQLNFTMNVPQCIGAKKVFIVVSKAPGSSADGTAAASDPPKKPANAVVSTPFEITPQPATCPAKS